MFCSGTVGVSEEDSVVMGIVGMLCLGGGVVGGVDNRYSRLSQDGSHSYFSGLCKAYVVSRVLQLHTLGKVFIPNRV